MKRIVLIGVLAGGWVFGQQVPAPEHARPAAAPDPATQAQQPARTQDPAHAQEPAESRAPAHAQPAAAPPHDPPASSGEAHARDAVKHGEGHETQPMANEIWWKWANFAVLALGLGYLIGKNAPGFFRGRSESIQKEISEASAVRQEAEARAAAIEKQIANLSAEVEGLKAKSREEITREGERIQAESRAQIEKVQRQAEADIASAAKNAAQELKAHSAELAVQLAARQIENRMTEQVQENLTDGFIEDVRRKAALN